MRCFKLFDNVVKIKIDDNKMDMIDNYGIYEYFESSDNHVKLNMMSFLSDNHYVITTGYAHRYSHFDLEKRTHDLIDDYSVSISSFDNRIIIVGNCEMSESDYYVLYGILKEIEEYTTNTSIQKTISINVSGIHGNYVSNFNLNSLIAKILDRIYNPNSIEKIKRKDEIKKIN